MIPDDIGDRMTAASLGALAVALGVGWSRWYPPFVLELAASPNEARPHWLAGGFMFASPRDVYKTTLAFRTEKLFFSGAPSWNEAGPEWPQRPLPDRYVVVGRTGEGAVVVDSFNDAPALLWLDKEGYWREPLIDFVSLGIAPADVARAIISGAAPA